MKSRKPRLNSPTIKKVRIWGKGQFTIPVEIRENMGIKENMILEVFQAGKAIVATPEKLLVNELADRVREKMEGNELNLKELLADLREGKHEYETD